MAFNRRSATGHHDTPLPWTEVHGYLQGLAPRGQAQLDACARGAGAPRSGTVRASPSSGERAGGEGERFLESHLVFCSFS